MFDFIDTGIDGFHHVRTVVRSDARGAFVKTFHHDAFAERGLETNFREMYYSISGKHVLRGMHFQLPPHQHAKIVYCISGRVMDVGLDLRRQSPTFGQHRMRELDSDKGDMVYLAAGLAHGFCVVSESATLGYIVATAYAPEHDTGVRWDSCGIDWPTRDVLVSERDQRFPTLAAFRSPF